MAPVRILADPPQSAVWGSDRDAPLDDALGWLTLVRFLGWQAQLDPAARHDVAVGPFAIERRDGEPVSGTTLAWTGPGPPREWRLAEPLKARRASGERTWATLDGVPVVAAGDRSATLGLDPFGAAAAAVWALLKRVLVSAAPAPAAWLDWTGTLVPRMDDPGASARAHLSSWSYATLGEDAWARLTDALRHRGARMTIGYTPGWADDGDPERGELRIDGEPAERVPGAVHPSPRVRYASRAGRTDDHGAEHRGILALRDAGAGDVELHGYAHVRDPERWAAAPDRYDAVTWYRELEGEAQPVAEGLALLRSHFGAMPTTLVCPGNAWTEATFERALEAGFELVAAEGVAFRDGGRFCWSAGVPTLYLGDVDPRAFDAELPVVGLFHDREPSLNGVDWVTQSLDRWSAAGMRRCADFRELAAALAMRPRLTAEGLGWRLHTDGRPLRPRGVTLRFPGAVPATVAYGTGRLRVQALDGGLARVVVA